MPPKRFTMPLTDRITGASGRGRGGGPPSAPAAAATFRRTLRLGLRGGRAGGRAGDEHRAEDVGPVEQVLGRAGEAELALLHEHGAVGELQRDVDRLLDHHDGEAGGVDRLHHVDELADHGGGQAERQLVDQEELGVGDERLAHGQHLLLAAGEVAGHLVDAVAQPREQVEHALLGLAHRGVVLALEPAGEAQVVAHGQGGEHALAARHHHDAPAGDLVGGQAAEVLAGEGHRAGGAARAGW